MKFRTLHELGHDERDIQLIDHQHVQVGGTHYLRDTDIVLVPQPTNDRNDPLRLPRWRKWMAFLNVCLLTFMTTAWVGGLAPAFYILTQEFNINVSQSTGLLTWPVLSAGLCNFFWIPTAEYYGRRPVFFFASLAMFACEIWSAVSTSYDSLLASRVIGAFMGSCTESMGALIVNDIFFLHERGSKMGVYIIALYLGNSIGPLVTGYIVQGPGWRWASWVCAIISGINVLGMFFFFPETRYSRSIDAVAEKPRQPDTAEKQTGEQVIENVTETSSSLEGPKKTWLEELSLWSGTAKKSYFNHFIRPFPLLAYPAVAWASLTYSVGLAWLVGAGSLSSFVFQIPPYNFSAGTNGLINIPGLIGNLVGAYAGGKLTDTYARHHAARNGGRFVPESRLVLLIIPAIIGPAGLLMFGFGAQRSLHWAVLFVGYGFVNIVPAAANIAMTYVMDSYFEAAAEGLLVVNGVKNVAAFGFTYGFIPWTASAGYETVFGTMAGIWIATLLMAVPLYIWGKEIRNYTTLRMKVILF